MNDNNDNKDMAKLKNVANKIITILDKEKIDTEGEFYGILAIILESCCVHNKSEINLKLLETLCEEIKDVKFK